MISKCFVPFPVLITDRLILRQLLIHDEQEILLLRSDKEINKYLDRQESKTIDDARDFINKVHENTSKNNSIYWAITLAGKNVLVGTICLFSFSDADEKCEIGYELLTDFQGQGIMKEAAEKVIHYAFNRLKVQTIEAIFHKDNKRSINLLDKLLFGKTTGPGNSNPELICYHLRNPF